MQRTDLTDRECIDLLKILYKHRTKTLHNLILDYFGGKRGLNIIKKLEEA